MFHTISLDIFSPYSFVINNSNSRVENWLSIKSSIRNTIYKVKLIYFYSSIIYTRKILRTYYIAIIPSLTCWIVVHDHLNGKSNHEKILSLLKQL